MIQSKNTKSHCYDFPWDHEAEAELQMFIFQNFQFNMIFSSLIKMVYKLITLEFPPIFNALLTPLRTQVLKKWNYNKKGFKVITSYELPTPYINSLPLPLRTQVVKKMGKPHFMSTHHLSFIACRRLAYCSFMKWTQGILIGIRYTWFLLEYMKCGFPIFFTTWGRRGSGSELI